MPSGWSRLLHDLDAGRAQRLEERVGVFDLQEHRQRALDDELASRRGRAARDMLMASGMAATFCQTCSPRFSIPARSSPGLRHARRKRREVCVVAGAVGVRRLDDQSCERRGK